jgi:O-antigen/teichoic acid export membrane protein
MRVGQKSFIYFLSKIGATLAGFVATIYLARILGAGTLGTYYLVIAVLTWLKMFSTMGIAKSVKKRISETDEPSEFLTAGVLLQAASLLVVTTAIVVFQSQFRSYTGFERIDILLLLLFAGAFFSFVTSVLVGENLTHVSGALQPLDRVTRTVAQVAFVLLGFNLLGLFFGYIIGSILAATVGLYYVSARFSYPDRSHFRSLWAYAKFSWLGSFSNRTLASMDTLVLGVFVTTDLIGIYEIAWNVASVLAVFGVAINTGLFPEISSLDADETESIAELAQTGVAYAGVFVIPGLVGGLILGEVILSVYSQEFRQGYLILVLLIFARLISTYKNQFVNIIDATNRPDIGFRINAVFVVTNISLNFLLVYVYGWVGAAVATIISAAVGVIIAYGALTRLTAFQFPISEVLKQLVAAVAMGIPVYVGAEYLSYQVLPSLLLVPAGAGVYFGVLLSISLRFRTTVRANIPF